MHQEKKGGRDIFLLRAKLSEAGLIGEAPERQVGLRVLGGRVSEL